MSVWSRLLVPVCVWLAEFLFHAVVPFWNSYMTVVNGKQQRFLFHFASFSEICKKSGCIWMNLGKYLVGNIPTD